MRKPKFLSRSWTRKLNKAEVNELYDYFESKLERSKRREEARRSFKLEIHRLLHPTEKKKKSVINLLKNSMQNNAYTEEETKSTMLSSLREKQNKPTTIQVSDDQNKKMVETNFIDQHNKDVLNVLESKNLQINNLLQQKNNFEKGFEFYIEDQGEYHATKMEDIFIFYDNNNNAL